MWDLFKKTIYKWIGENSFEHAAALAFATLFSLAPMLIILIGLTAIFFGREAVEGRVFGEIRAMVGTDGAATIQDILRKATFENKKTATLVGALLTLVGATGVFAQMKDALNQIWSVKPEPKTSDIVAFLKNRLISIAMLLVIGFILLVSMVISALLSYLGDTLGYYLPFPPWILLAINTVVSTAVITLLFAMIFKILPDVLLRWRDVMLGAAFTAILFTGGKFLIAYYIGNSTVTSVYGAAASLVVILLWIYYSSLILFLGASFIRVYTHQRGIKVYAAPHAVWVRHETYIE